MGDGVNMVDMGQADRTLRQKPESDDGVFTRFRERLNEIDWDEYIDVLYERWVAEHEAYAFEDNYEPFETVNPKQVNRS
jgi:hypothetical protein